MSESTKTQVYVIGGSNSMLADGWTTQLSEQLPQTFSFLNESVGGVPCIMGYYRLVAIDKLKPGDIVLWEYALNDQNHIDDRGYDPELLLRFCEHTIRLCHLRHLRFIPLIFATRTTSALPEMTEYRRKLRDLFAHYGLDHFDVTEELPKKMGRPRVPKFVYMNESHYKPDAFVSRFIATRALALVRSGAGVIRSAEQIFGTDVVRVETITRFDGGVSEPFKNNRVSVVGWTPTTEGKPVEIKLEDGPFRLVAVVMLCTSFGGAFRVRAGKREFAISATYREDKFTKPLLRVFTLSDDLDSKVSYAPGSAVTFTWDDGSLPVQTDFGFVSDLSGEQLMGRQSSVVGLVLEQLTG